VVAQRLRFSRRAIRLVNELTQVCNARLVINSNWPLTMSRRRTLVRLHQTGLNPDLLHDDWNIRVRGML